MRAFTILKNLTAYPFPFPIVTKTGNSFGATPTVEFASLHPKFFEIFDNLNGALN
jgi:hypothetical protein